MGQIRRSNDQPCILKTVNIFTCETPAKRKDPSKEVARKNKTYILYVYKLNRDPIRYNRT